MQIFHDLSDLAKIQRRAYLAIGAFDGVHLGHQAVMRAAREDAAGAGGLAVAFTFDPLPARVLRPDNPPPLLSSPLHKLTLIAAQGMEAALVQRFDMKFASIPPRAFIHQLAAATHDGGLREICVGHNFRFGHNRAGDAELIVKMGGELGFAVKVIEPVKVGGEVISSTVVRRAVARGDLEKAATMLGRLHTVWGKVARGAGRGEQLGFPTANVTAIEEMLPPNGVYAVRAKLLEGGKPLAGVANLGVRPTFEKEASAPLLEIHLFHFAEKIYGAQVEVEFVQKLRDERKFASPDELRAQIQRDVATARHLLQTHGD